MGYSKEESHLQEEFSFIKRAVTAVALLHVFYPEHSTLKSF